MGAESCLYRKESKTESFPRTTRKRRLCRREYASLYPTSMDTGTRVLIANSRSFDHDSWRTGQNCGYLQLHRTICWRNGPSRRILERPELFLKWAQPKFPRAPNAFRYLNRDNKSTNIIAGASALKLRRPKTTQTLAFPRRRGLLSRLIQKPTAAQAHPRGRGLSTHAECSDGTPANLGGSCVYRQAIQQARSSKDRAARRVATAHCRSSIRQPCSQYRLESFHSRARNEGRSGYVRTAAPS